MDRAKNWDRTVISRTMLSLAVWRLPEAHLFFDELAGTFRNVPFGLVICQVPGRWGREAGGWKETQGDSTEP